MHNFKHKDIFWHSVKDRAKIFLSVFVLLLSEFAELIVGPVRYNILD
jgi:hypothetical protein